MGRETAIWATCSHTFSAASVLLRSLVSPNPRLVRGEHGGRTVAVGTGRLGEVRNRLSNQRLTRAPIGLPFICSPRVYFLGTCVPTLCWA